MNHFKFHFLPHLHYYENSHQGTPVQDTKEHQEVYTLVSADFVGNGPEPGEGMLIKSLPAFA
jgi:hypothetical protein